MQSLFESTFFGLYKLFIVAYIYEKNKVKIKAIHYFKNALLILP